ncbi:T-complex protein 1 subunit alpha [Camellia lanceoleosa]|uniref:T-complex protein 1 subunit alpha n=1 Tax=Camellia lanceoleosa TaxID=1840588 RepID=A0ACC0IT51_9ERIC|nr:T-complex protein 1 subunit alpha [Camellia lanceoleosa]
MGHRLTIVHAFFMLCLQVTVGQLITKDHEVKILEVNGVNCARSAGNAIEEFGGSVHEDDFVDMGVEGNVTGGDGGIYDRNVEQGSTSVHFRTPSRNVPRNAEKHVIDAGPHVCYTTEKIAKFEVEINEKDIVILELRVEVNRLRQANKVQTLHLVGGFGSMMQAKDDEVKKLTTENAELQRAVNVLEEQLAEHEVHNVTQAFRGVDVNVEVSVWDVTLVREQTNGISEIQHGVMAGTEVVVISPNMTEGGRLNVGEKSFVQDVKCKVRIGLTLTGVECLGVSRQASKSNVVHVPSITSNVDCNAKNGGCTDVIDVDDIDVQAKKKSGFDINNRHAVWKMMTAAEKKKITDAYNRDGDKYDGHGYGVVVYFTDVKSLVRQSEIRGNVIDAYVVLLNAEQERINEGIDAADKSYFFSSICLDMMKNNNVQSRNRLDCAIIVSAVMCQYVCHVDVRRSLHGGNCIVLRAIMVKSFLNDPRRGLKNDLDWLRVRTSDALWVLVRNVPPDLDESVSELVEHFSWSSFYFFDQIDEMKYMKLDTSSINFVFKMLVDDIGDVTITNDGAIILNLLDVEHSAAKVEE